ncbi:MAG TPA: GNAT family protein [Bryobacteraceae bacterium]|jgi:ribosomal-protein-serine acetyltransferase|nr:GNAT family protein [Bryobacteraceae bacterium]
MFRKTIRDGVYLKLLEERHAPEVFAVVDRERAYLREWLPWVDMTTEDDHTLNFIRTSLEQFASNDGFSAGIWSGDEFIGGIGTHKIDWLYRKVEVGYWIAQKFQGRGIVTDACRAVIDYAMDDLKLNRVEIHCAAGNGKSCAIPKRLGFQWEGLLREAQLLNGEYQDIHVYAVLAREWEKLKR